MKALGECDKSDYVESNSPERTEHPLYIRNPGISSIAL